MKIARAIVLAGRQTRVHARLRLDFSWRDWGRAVTGLLGHTPQEHVIRRRIEALWTGPQSILCLSVRTGFDLYLQALALPAGSEVLISAVTISDMAKIIAAHGLVAIPIDVDALGNIDVGALDRARTVKTRAIVIAHLLGRRMALDAVVQFAQQHSLPLIEDCAQAFSGPDYTGHPAATISLFSFGPIKSHTAFGGALLCVRDAPTHAIMCALERRYPRQSRRQFGQRLLKFAALKALTSSPYTYARSLGVLEALELDPHVVLPRLTRGFGTGASRSTLRKRPTLAQQQLLLRRLRQYQKAQQQRKQKLAQQIVVRCSPASMSLAATTWPEVPWLFTVRTRRPGALVDIMSQNGFDASSLTTGLQVVDAPTAGHQESVRAKEMLRELVYLPVHIGLTHHDAARLAELTDAHLRGDTC